MMASTDRATLRPQSSGDETETAAERRVLLVEDEPALGRAAARILGAAGYQVEIAQNGALAADLLMHRSFGAVVSDIHLPGTSGVDLLRMIRAYDLDLPVILMTGGPTIETASSAVELGAMLYLVKPVEPRALVQAVGRAMDMHDLAVARRAVLRADRVEASTGSDRLALEARFGRALDSLWVAYQPIVDLRKNTILGYEALLRSREPSMPSPLDVIAGAEQLDRISELGQRIRARAIDGFATLDEDALLFLNLHPSELLDASLYDSRSCLSPFASRVVLEVTERTAIDRVKDVEARTSVLRFHGFKIAIDDLGAGYAGLTSFVSLEPEFVKLDMTLVRGVDSSKMRQHIVKSVVDLCGKLSMRVVAEGVETASELRTVRMLGCDAAQGFYIGRPTAEFARAADLNV